MSDSEELQASLRARIRDAEVLAARYRARLRRELLLWITVAAVLGTLVGYAVALWLVDPVIIVACGGLRA